MEAGEFQRAREPRPLTATHQRELDVVRLEWEREPSIATATAFAGACLTAARKSEANDAARYILDNSDAPFPVHIARTTLALGNAEADSPAPPSQRMPIRALWDRIARARQRTIADPRSAIAWADLARGYTADGQLDLADRALRIARSLAPLSRYLTRVSARFFVQTGQPDKAYQLLDSMPRTREDPWLMAAFLSVAGIASLPPRSLRSARRILEDENYEPIERAELATELATIEMQSGGSRRARRLFERSLRRPTDNSLAQVEWASHQLPTLAVQVSEIEIPFASEARARAAAERGEWQTALDSCIDWILDQPFDTEAAIRGSYVASVGLDEWAKAAEIAKIGLRAQPSNATLVNNFAYALIEAGDLPRAAVALARTPTQVEEPGDEMALRATAGLLKFRLGDSHEGRALYREAIELARRTGDRRGEAMAKAMLVREEVRAGDDTGVIALLEEAQKAAAAVSDAGATRCVARAAELVERNHEPKRG